MKYLFDLVVGLLCWIVLLFGCWSLGAWVLSLLVNWKPLGVALSDSPCKSASQVARLVGVPALSVTQLVFSSLTLTGQVGVVTGPKVGE